MKVDTKMKFKKTKRIGYLIIKKIWTKMNFLIEIIGADYYFQSKFMGADYFTNPLYFIPPTFPFKEKLTLI